MAKYTQEQFDQFMKDNDEVLTLAQDAGIGLEQLKDGALNMSAFEPSMGEAVSAGGKAALAGLKKQGYGLARAAVEGSLEEDEPVSFMGKEYNPKDITGADLGDVIRDLIGEDTLKELSSKLATDDANVSRKLSEEMPYIEDPDSFKATVIDAIGGVLPSATTGLVAGLLTRSPQLAATVVGAGSYGTYYGQSRDDGKTPEQSRERALRFAAMESAGEAIPLASALGKLGIKGFLGRVGTSALTEGVQEGATEVAQAVHDNVAYGDAMPEDLMQRAWRSAKAGALGGGVLGGGGYVMDKVTPDLSQQTDQQSGSVNPESVDLVNPEVEPVQQPGDGAVIEIQPEDQVNQGPIEKIDSGPVLDQEQDESAEFQDQQPIEEVEQEEAEEVPGTGVQLEGKAHKVYTPDNTPIETKVKIVDANDLVTSHDIEGVENKDYPQELQQRDRSKPALVSKVKKISKTLNPERLDLSADISSGAPVVNGAVVESGNGRSIAIKEAYKKGNGEKYKEHLIANADKYGIDPEEIKSMERPVLVLQRDSNLSGKDLQDFTKKANQDLGIKMSPVERAKSDSELLDENDLAEINLGDQGDMTAASNHKFLTRFANKLGEEEAAGYVTGENKWNSEIGKRATAAVFQKAYGDKDLTSNVFEEPTQDSKRIMSSLARAAGHIAKLKGYEGGDLGLGKSIADAANLMRAAARKGQSAKEHISQLDMLDQPSPAAMDIAEMMSLNSTSAKRMGDVLVSLAKQVESEHQGSMSGDLFNGGVPPLNDILKANEEMSNAKAAEKQQETGELFGANPPRLQSETEGSGRNSEQEKGKRAETENTKRVGELTPASEITDKQLNELLGKSAIGAYSKLKGMGYSHTDATKLSARYSKHTTSKSRKKHAEKTAESLSLKEIANIATARDRLGRVNQLIKEGYSRDEAIALNKRHEESVKAKLKENRAQKDKSKKEPAKADDNSSIREVIKNTKSGNEINTWLKENASNPFYRVLAGRLPKLLSNSLEIKSVKKGDYAPVKMRKAKGLYQKTNGGKETIYLWNDDSLSADDNANETTVMHELVHAATAQAIRVGRKKPDSSLGKAVNDLEDLYKDVVNDIRTRSVDGKLTDFEKSKVGRQVRNLALANVDEFVAWGMTDKNAQKILKGIDVTPSQTAWNKFVSTVGKMLGLKPSSNNALARLIETTDRVMIETESNANQDKVKLSQGTSETGNINAVSEEDAQAVRDKFNPDAGKLTKGDELLKKAKAARDPKQAKSLVSDVKSEIRRGFVDKYEPLKRLEDKMFADGTLTDKTASAWRLANTIHAAHGVMSVLFDYGKVRYDKQSKVIVPSTANEGGLKKVLSQLNEPNELDDFFMWIASNRANEINQRALSATQAIVDIRAEKRQLRDQLSKTSNKLEQGRILKKLKDADSKINSLKKKAKVKERFLDAKTIRDGMLLDTIARKDGRSREQLFDKVLNEFNDYRESVLRVAEDTGIITSENREMWSDQFYVPFYRVMENDTKIGPHPAPGLSRQDAIKKLKGSTKQLGDLLDNTLMNFNFLIDASLRNRAAAQAIENAEAAGIAHKTTEHKKGKQSTYVMVDGGKQWYDIDDPAYYAAVTATGMTKMPFQDNPIMKLANKSKVAFTKLTTIVPKFSIAMIAKDSILAPALGRVGMAKGGPLRGAYKYGMGGISDTKAEMLTTGASFDLGYDAQDRKKQLNKQFTHYADKVVPIQHAVSALKGLADYYGDFQNMAENANRTAVYLAAKEDGKTRLESAFESADMQNFSQSGAWPTIRFLNGIVPFLNVGIQGIDKTMRSFGDVYKVAAGMADAETKHKATRFLTVTSILSTATIALALANADDEEYKELPDYMRNTYWFLRFGDRKGEYFLIPKPFSIGSVINVSEKVTDNITGVAKANNTLEYIRDTALQTLNINPIPQIAKPWVELYMNKNMFTDQPIENSRDLRYSSAERYDYKTSELAKFFGNEKLSPKQIDHLLKAYFSSGGETVSEGINLLVNAFSDNPLPEKYWYERSVFSRFYSDRTAPTFTKSQQRFYKVYGEFIEAKNDFKRAVDMGDAVKAKEIIDTKGYKVQLAPMLDKYKRKISKVTKAIDGVRNNKLMSAEEKRKQIDLYNALKANMYQEVMNAVDTTMKQIESEGKE